MIDAGLVDDVKACCTAKASSAELSTRNHRVDVMHRPNGPADSRSLRQFGIGLACDDFGTVILIVEPARAALDTLKLDKSFIVADAAANAPRSFRGNSRHGPWLGLAIVAEASRIGAG